MSDSISGMPASQKSNNPLPLPFLPEEESKMSHLGKRVFSPAQEKASQTPMRKHRFSKILSLYLKKIQKIPINGIVWKGQRYDLKLRGGGTYSHVYFVIGQPDKVAKIYQERRLSTEQNVRDRYAYIAEQYKSLGEMNPENPHQHQAKIFNIETAQDDGFLLVEDIPEPFPAATWTANKKLQDLSEKDRNLLSQIKTMFQYIANKNLMVDLRWDNVGLGADGKVKLFDWHEEPDEKDELSKHIKTEIKSFAEGTDGRVNQEIFAYLCPENFPFEGSAAI